MSDGFKAMTSDLQRIADQKRSDFWTAIDYVVVNRIGHENVTAGRASK